MGDQLVVARDSYEGTEYEIRSMGRHRGLGSGNEILQCHVLVGDESCLAVRDCSPAARL